VCVDAAGRTLAPGQRIAVRVTGSGAYDLFARAETADPLALIGAPA